MQIEIYDKSEALYDAASTDTDILGSPARADLYHDLLAVRAREYVRLVENLISQEAYEFILKESIPSFWAQYAKRSANLFEAEAHSDMSFMQGVRLLLDHWIAASHRRVASRKSPRPGPRPAGNMREPTPFPNRAAWLKQRLRERSWNKNDVRRFGGPDRRTVQRVLDGLRIREDRLEELAQALSKKAGTVKPLDIPSD